LLVTTWCDVQSRRPLIANFIRCHEVVRMIVREALVDPVVWWVTLSQSLWTPG
jgi:hypothetical protein